MLEQMQSISDVCLTIRVELDQTTMTLAELAELSVGRILHLSRPTGENVDVYAEEALLGWGEILLFDGVVTVRLADMRNARLPDIADEAGQAAGAPAPGN